MRPLEKAAVYGWKLESRNSKQMKSAYGLEIYKQAKDLSDMVN